MKISAQLIKNGKPVAQGKADGLTAEKADLVLAFGGRVVLEGPNIYELLRAEYPNAQIVLCSTAGDFRHQRP